MLPIGPQNAKILILSDWPSPLDLAKQQPLTDQSGTDLAQMLHESGMILGECLLSCLSSRTAPLIKGKEDFSSWLSHTKSPKVRTWTRCHNSWVDEQLEKDIVRTQELITLVKPNVVIALGPLALFALTGHTSVKKWRGSQLRVSGSAHSYTVIPSYHPRYIKRDHSVRATTVHDLRRARRVSGSAADLKPTYNVRVRPTFQQALFELRSLLIAVRSGPTRISVDIETRAGHIACIGFAINKHGGFCIPLMCVERPAGYWSELEEVLLVDLMREIMTHENAMCFGQNFVYDTQYIWRFWFFVPRTWYDTMTAQHVLFPGTPKGLDYLASLYCEYYVYWKEDHRTTSNKAGE